jgi:AraC family transcriptional regulator of arabinose operon
MATTASYRSVPRQLSGIPLHCVGVGAQEADRACKWRTLDTYAAVFVERGNGWLETERAGRHEVRAPALFWLHPGIRHTYGPDRFNWHEQWALFDGKAMTEPAMRELLDPRRPLHHVQRPTELTDLFTGMRTDFASNHQFATALVAAAVFRLIMLIAADGRIAAATGQGSTVRAAMERLTDPGSANMQVAALARETGVPPSTLRRNARQQFGMSIKQHQLRTRLNKAKELLATTELSITDISMTVFFPDPYYFSRIFRRKEGMSPSEFRARHRQ